MSEDPINKVKTANRKGNDNVVGFSPAFPQLDGFSQNLLANIQGGVIICQFDPAEGISKAIYLSEGWTEITGYTLPELYELFNGNPQALIYPEDAEEANRTYIEQTKNGNSYQLEYRFKRRDGKLIWAMDHGIITFSADGYNQNQSILTDITRIKENEEKIRMSEMRFRIASKASHAAVFEFDIPENRYLYIENAEEIFQASSSEVITAFENTIAEIDEADIWSDMQLQPALCGIYNIATVDYKLRKAMLAWYHREDITLLICAYNEAMQNGAGECEVRVRRKNEGYIWCRLHLVVLSDDKGNPQRVIGHLTNTDEEHQQTERLRCEAQQDALTRLLNKNAIREMVEQTLVRQPQNTYTLLMLDVDNFKRVNDRLGHLFGDAVLMDVSAKLKRLFLKEVAVARVGGDEFAVFFQNELTVKEAAASAEEICVAFRYAYAGEKADYKISCSVGVAFSVTGDTYDTLFRRADTALYEAKARGKDQYAIYSHEMDAKAIAAPNDIHQTDDRDTGELKIKERIFELLYNSVDFGGSVNMILSLLGQLLDVSRVYILENTQDNLFSHCIYEWCADGVLPFKAEQLIHISQMNYFSVFDDEGIFDCRNISQLPSELRKEYEARGTNFTFQVAITEEGRIQGVVGYDSIEHPVSRASEQIELMIFAARVTGTFIIKKRADEEAKLFNQNKMEALDLLPCALYVIDKEYCLQYVNNFVLSFFPEIKLGQKCHEVFMKNDVPCPDCPAAKCENEPCGARIRNPFIKMDMMVTAANIHWSGIPDMRLVCCQIFEANGKSVY